MKAAVYYGKEGIRVEEKAKPEIGSKNVLIRNLRGGICGTDINIVKAGTDQMGISYGAEFGHELFGEVVELGAEVPDDIKVGMRVGVNPITAQKGGPAKSLECGAFSQYVIIEDAALNYNLFEFDPSVPPEAAVLMEPMSVGFHGAFRTNPQPGEKIVVLGAGPIGLSAAAGLIGEGIPDVCVVDIDDWRLNKAKELGALTLNTKNKGLAEGLVEHFGSVSRYGMELPDIDVYVDAAGAPALFKEVMKNVRTNTRISVIAVYKDEVPVNLAQVMSNEIRIQGSMGYTTEEILKVVDHLSKKKTNIAEIVTDVYKLDEVQAAFDKAIDAKETLKVVVDVT
ncbi:zinc-dependent alcohol dehydrogenase [Aquibacillus saliphilus]|uniref:zinc-dependent alcohol dehydrogenase n=1 Tax=Aquibacillus saliphilus TaxID=1909422 RepID=UPI001CEFEECB|nr:zinc-binding dehydrogenase [Aquibacillus saliphilus]